MDNIVIFGASGHARVVYDMIRLQGLYQVVGTIAAQEEFLDDLPYLGTDHQIADIIRKYQIMGGIIAIGDHKIRQKIAVTVKEICPDFLFIMAIHPSAVISKSVTVGAGSAVMAGAIINPHTHIGQHCIVNTKASLDHDNIIEDYATISPGVTTGGNVTIKQSAMIGIGACLLPNVTIGTGSIVGAGSVVLKDIPEHMTCFGVPARIQQKKG